MLYTALAPYPVQCTHVHLRNRTLCVIYSFSQCHTTQRAQHGVLCVAHECTSTYFLSRLSNTGVWRQKVGFCLVLPSCVPASLRRRGQEGRLPLALLRRTWYSECRDTSSTNVECFRVCGALDLCTVAATRSTTASRAQLL